ncbi:Alpha/Beta hydrolase protein [Microdochium trichocladiopsis]|uniref:Carboxypeptidase n=1 Tax=Microdochium trichocladiopsis TaxID=1682393 RepID=A0A9P8XXW8_9PEZI|nr:Alpha/Beta hydrolase protein [Microdochium trichocladiopsis]KAH7025650.1 Alpha/Beta hydrolase protein [Microdochium trichocladiopsis]
MLLLPRTLFALATCLSFLPATQGQSPSSPGFAIVESKIYPGASISFKETNICETTKGVKGFSGYVNLPPSPADGRGVPISTWFWFFEARNSPNTSPLTVWLQGGPGSPSSPAAVGENGPCRVLSNSRDTASNPWSWNTNSNMLYIDQPAETGFSYSSLVNGTINAPKSPFTVGEPQATNSSIIAGTFSSQSHTFAPNTTDVTAAAMWQFLQVFQEFPTKGYSCGHGKISIWGESYGGHYVPTYSSYILAQNEKIRRGELAKTFRPLNIETVGLINACIDAETQIPKYPLMAVNNTYGIKIYNDTVHASTVSSLPQCMGMVKTCRTMAKSQDPQGWGSNSAVNKACFDAFQFCFGNVAREDDLGLLDSAINKFDIAGHKLFNFPPRWAAGYLNDGDVHRALGVPLNFTGYSTTVSQAFGVSGDFMKGRNLAILGELLDQDIQVALVYGDRDYQCNWYGGQAVSLAIKSKLSAGFQRAGYTYLQTNESYVGGLVRQYGKLSFSRVFNAGHEVPYFQAETAWQIFDRASSHKDVATGQLAANDSTYATKGKDSASTTGDVPFNFEGTVSCYFWDMQETCTPQQAALVANGSAIMKDYLLIGAKLADGTELKF